MLKGLILGILIGVLLVAGGLFFYFASGWAPVAVTAPEIALSILAEFVAVRRNAALVAKEPAKAAA